MKVDALGVSSPDAEHHHSAHGHPMSGEGTRPTYTIEQTLEQLLQSLLEMGICASDVQDSALSSTPGGVASGYPGGLMGRKVSQTMEQLAKLYSYTGTVQDVMIPLEVVNFVDQGKNPHMYTREFIERVAGENMYTNGMLFAILDYRDILTRSLGDAFPELVNHIRANPHPAGRSASKEEPQVKQENGTYAMDRFDAHLGSNRETGVKVEP